MKSCTFFAELAESYLTYDSTAIIVHNVSHKVIFLSKCENVENLHKYPRNVSKRHISNIYILTQSICYIAIFVTPYT